MSGRNTRKRRVEDDDESDSEETEARIRAESPIKKRLAGLKIEATKIEEKCRQLGKNVKEIGLMTKNMAYPTITFTMHVDGEVKNFLDRLRHALEALESTFEPSVWENADNNEQDRECARNTRIGTKRRGITRAKAALKPSDGLNSAKGLAAIAPFLPNLVIDKRRDSVEVEILEPPAEDRTRNSAADKKTMPEAWEEPNTANLRLQLKEQNSDNAPDNILNPTEERRDREDSVETIATAEVIAKTTTVEKKCDELGKKVEELEKEVKRRDHTITQQDTRMRLMHATLGMSEAKVRGNEQNIVQLTEQLKNMKDDITKLKGDLVDKTETESLQQDMGRVRDEQTRMRTDMTKVNNELRMRRNQMNRVAGAFLSTEEPDDPMVDGGAEPGILEPNQSGPRDFQQVSLNRIALNSSQDPMVLAIFARMPVGRPDAPAANTSSSSSSPPASDSTDPAPDLPNEVVQANNSAQMPASARQE